LNILNEGFKYERDSVPNLANNSDVYFKSLSFTNVLFKLEMNAQQSKIFWIVRWIKYLMLDVTSIKFFRTYNLRNQLTFTELTS
jgi:hypothetical protein